MNPDETTPGEVFALVEEIATRLAGYTAEAGNHSECAKLVGTDGATVYFIHRRYERPARLHVYGGYPKDGERLKSARDWGAIPYNETAPEINVSMGRSPKVLAADILRRFLPRYEEVYGSCRAKQADQDEWRRSRAVRVGRLAAILGERPTGEPDSPKVRVYRGGMYATLTEGAIDAHGVPESALEEIAVVLARCSRA